MKSRNLIKERLKEDYIYNLCSYKREIIRGRVSSDSIHLGQKRKKSSTFELLYSESHLYSRQSRHKGFATISSGNNIQHKGKEQLKKRSSWLVEYVQDGWKSRGIYLRKISSFNNNAGFWILLKQETGRRRMLKDRSIWFKYQLYTANWIQTYLVSESPIFFVIRNNSDANSVTGLIHEAHWWRQEETNPFCGNEIGGRN